MVKKVNIGNNLDGAKQLAAYRDGVRVRAAQTALRRSRGDWESFRIVREFGSNAFRNLLAKVGIDSYGKFLDFNEEQLWAIPGVGETKVKEFKLARELFDCGSRCVIQPPDDTEEEELDIPPMSDDIPRANETVPEWRLQELGIKGQNLLRALCPQLHARDVAGLTQGTIIGKKGFGKKTADAVMALVKACRDGSVWTPSGVPAMHANEFDSLSDMIVKTVQGILELKDNSITVMRMYLGLLDATERATLEATGQVLGLTRERVRQMRNKIQKALRSSLSTIGFSELKSWASDFFEGHGLEASEAEIIESAANAFGWIKPTAFSLRLVLGELGFETLINPKTGLVAWNKDGGYDWVKTYRPPTLTERRHAAIKAVLQEAGWAGLTVDEIVSACAEKHASADVGEGNVRGCLGNGGDLDGEGTRMIGLLRGKRGAARTLFTLNTFFRDDETKSVLQKAGEEVKAYMEKTGFGIVDVWKIWYKYKEKLPKEKTLPKLGFYMMMRDVCAGGLCYKDYPRISYEGMDVCENAYWWELYEYFHYCGHQKAGFAQIMSFFIDCLGIQPTIALSCAFCSMGLEKDAEMTAALYDITRPPVPADAPKVLLKTVKRDKNLSLVKADGKFAIHSDYFDEAGHAIFHPTYVKVFMRNLEKSGIGFSPAELAQLTDSGWCKKNLKIRRPLLVKTNNVKGVPGTGYWREKFKFNDEFYVCSNWNQANKSAFDAWATIKAKQAGFDFTPYEIGVDDD